MLRSDAIKMMQYAIDRANQKNETLLTNEFIAWCDHIDCLQESLNNVHGIDINVQIINNEYQIGETK